MPCKMLNCGIIVQQPHVGVPQGVLSCWKEGAIGRMICAADLAGLIDKRNLALTILSARFLSLLKQRSGLGMVLGVSNASERACFGIRSEWKEIKGGLLPTRPPSPGSRMLSRSEKSPGEMHKSALWMGIPTA